MKISSERDILPVVRETVSGNVKAMPRFIEVMNPLIDDFVSRGMEVDEYHGWALSLKFLSPSNAECEPFQPSLGSQASGWKYIPEGKNDCAYVVPGKGVIKIHLFSFLWNM